MDVAITPPTIGRGGPSVAARAAERIRALRAPVQRWLPRVAMAALVAGGVTGGVVGGRYAMNALGKARAARPKVVAPAPAARPQPPGARPQPPARPGKPTGGLRVSSTPSAAQVFVDGKPRGITPLEIGDLAVGRHTIELKSGSGSVQRTVNVSANTVVDIEESIFSGWVAVYSPFELVVSEGGRTLTPDERNQIMLPPGRHELRLVNRTLEFESVRQVELKPGETLRLSITPPPSTITVTANAPAQVWLDGERIGDVPVNNAPVPLGTHEIVVKRASGGERRFTVKVTTKPLTLNVEF